MRLSAALFLLFLACEAGVLPTGGGSSGGGAATGGGGDANHEGLTDAGDRWSPVRALFQASARDAGVPMGLVVFDASDTRRLELVSGGFTADTRVAVASASKLISSLVLFALVGRGALSLASTTGQVLGWTGPSAAITLEQLLSFTSGLPREAPCTLSSTTTLDACVQIISQMTLEAEPGTRFDYGSTHLAVAGRMAEVVTGQRFNQLFSSLVRTPLGLPAGVTYFTYPKASIGTENPLLAGGLRASMNEYAPMLQLAFHRGVRGEVTVGRPELFDAQARVSFPDAGIGNSPIASLGYDYRYGLCSWLECDTPATGCAVLSSPGAFGFTPWYDRDAGYVAILGMELERGPGDIGVVSFSVSLEQQIEPLIREALRE